MKVMLERSSARYACPRFGSDKHLQSIIHSMVVCRDSSVLAQLGTPDMKVPIAYGLSFPERIKSGADALDFSSLSALTFEPPDHSRYPGLALAWSALRAPAGSTAVLNAANEEAVAAFLNRAIRFDQIHSINQQVLDSTEVGAADTQSLEAVLSLDRRARLHAQRVIGGLSR